MHPLHCPTCLWCGARLIARIQALQRPRSEITARCRKVLADWMAMGHDETELRRLAKTPTPLQPLGGVATSDSDSPKPAKPRSAPKKSGTR
jgi:hypothetical protein